VGVGGGEAVAGGPSFAMVRAEVGAGHESWRDGRKFRGPAFVPAESKRRRSPNMRHPSIWIRGRFHFGKRSGCEGGCVIGTRPTGDSRKFSEGEMMSRISTGPTKTRYSMRNANACRYLRI
jgi:hypothetical protein